MFHADPAPPGPGSAAVKALVATAIEREATAAEAAPVAGPSEGLGAGKILLAGEHAVVYGRHSLAVPLPGVMRCRVVPKTEPGVHLRIPAWQADMRLEAGSDNLLQRCVCLILENLGLDAQAPLMVTIDANVPRGSGLGGSAALAVAAIRALAAHTGAQLTDDQVNAWAYASECLAHGAPSGVDNTVSTYGQCVLYRKATPPWLRAVRLSSPLRLIVGMTGQHGSTLEMVRQVAQGRDADISGYERLFDRIDGLTLNAVAALEQGDWPLLGALMSENHRLLQELEVSSQELDELCSMALSHGAYGAKLTGAGGGGAMIALCPPNREDAVLAAMQRGRYEALSVELPAFGGT